MQNLAALTVLDLIYVLYLPSRFNHQPHPPPRLF